MPFDLPPSSPVSLVALVVNLFIGAALSLMLSWHFQKFSNTVSNRNTYTQVFPLIVLTTILVITVVKSSLALSLGLVGALSIVRFRTPIKEPEELAYLFLAIGIGLGLGADHRDVTVVAALLILGIMGVRNFFVKSGRRDHNLYLNIDAPNGASNATLENITEILKQNSRVADVRRLDLQNGSLQATFLVELKDDEQLITVLNSLRDQIPDASITFVDQNQRLTG